MKKGLLFILILILVGNTAAFAGAAEAITPRQRAEQLLEGMSTEEKFGQVLLMDLRMWMTEESRAAQQTEIDRRIAEGDEEASEEKPQPQVLTELNDEVRRMIADYHLDNIILFGENCADTASLVRFTHDLQETARAAGLPPMLIGTDQEGGNVTRLGSGTCMSGSMAIGASADTNNAYLNGRVIGSELKTVGIQCDFAPVADVNVDPANPVIGMRSFSDDPAVAGEMAEAMAKGLKEQGIIPCAKHFPGHGNTHTDSHTGFPLIDSDRETWMRQEGSSFRYLIENGAVPMVMSAHIQYPELDDTRVNSAKDGSEIYLPATLSKRILTDILKGEMGFDGVVVTDAMRMDAIADNFDPQEAVIMALNAGADLICEPIRVQSLGELPMLDALYAALRTAVDTGELPMERLNDAALRVLTLKAEYGILDISADASADESIANALETVGGPANRAVERQIASDCVRPEYGGFFTPFAPKAEDDVVALVPYGSEAHSLRYAFKRMEKEGVIPHVDLNVICYQNEGTPSEDTLRALAGAEWTIVISEQIGSVMNDPEHWLNTYPSQVLESADRAHTAVICTGLPYQAERFSADWPCFLLFNYSGMSEADVDAERFTGKFGPAIPAGVEKIFGCE